MNTGQLKSKIDRIGDAMWPGGIAKPGRQHEESPHLCRNSLQRRYAAIVNSVERQKARQRARLAKLDALIASLQHRSFRGEL